MLIYNSKKNNFLLQDKELLKKILYFKVIDFGKTKTFSTCVSQNMYLRTVLYMVSYLLFKKV